jgi:hypothetical protein
MRNATSVADDERPDLPGVAAAWRFAMRHAPAGPGFRVGICDPDRKLVAATMLGTWAQVKTFSRQLEKVGYAAVAAGSVDEMQGCDVIYLRPPGSGDRPPAPR